MAAAALLLSSACGDEQLAPVPPGVEAIYGPAADTELTPYPSDRYTVTDDTATGLRVSISAANTTDRIAQPGQEVTLAELNAMNGFSTHGGVILSFSGPVDVTGIALRPYEDPATAAELRDAEAYRRADSPLILIDVDPDSPRRGETVGLVPRWWEQPRDDYYLADEFTLIAQPAVPLRPATRYLFVVTDALRARDGGPVHPSSLTRLLVAGETSGAYADQVRAGLAELEQALAVPTAAVVLATTFTTASIHDELGAMAATARSWPPPPLLQGWTLDVDQTSASDDRIRYRARFEAPEYRLPQPDGRWQIDDQGRPIVQEQVGLEVLANIWDPHTSEPRTVVIYGHGLGGDKGGSWGTTQRLSTLNPAVFAIDSPHHGSRAEDEGDELAPVFRFFGVDMDEGTFVIGRARDNFRQMAADQLELVRLIRSLATLDILPPGAPDGIPDLDTSRIFYLGHSFGAVQGATIFALAPEITHGVWNVGGAGLMTLLRDSGLFSLLVMSLSPPGVAEGAVARFMAAVQAIVDPGDPLNYARFAQQEPWAAVDGWTAREVLLQEVINDGIVPNSTSRALARAAGLPLIDPIDPISGLPSVSGPVTANLPSGVTGAISQFDRIDGDKMASHGELLFAPEARAQYVEFFASALGGDHGTIPSPYP
ncbi:MAG: hypothetical protein JRI68_23725 [Deltaproteobacteria bacterium]|nr:hypothetical protein [Deltaproteobacteria bacterium]